MLQWLSLSEEKESLLISISIFCLYKEGIVVMPKMVKSAKLKLVKS